MSRHNILSVAITALAVFACSSVGPGFKNHPADCAIGVPWADCLPGTAGYANGGGRVHREEAERQQRAEIASRQANTNAQCTALYQAPELDPIRTKVELHRANAEAAVPFEIAVNDVFPTDGEKVAIAKWASLREQCLKLIESSQVQPDGLNPLQRTFAAKDAAFGKEASAKVGDLIVSLYQQKLTYGEFAKKRYEIGSSALAAERQFREAALLADRDRQIQAQQLAQQKFQNDMAAWSAYVQSVAARQPQTIYINGTVRTQTNCVSQRFGSTVTTNCN
jgi:hypothetical protein